MSSRDNILKRLRDAQKPFTDVPPVPASERRVMQPVPDDADLCDLFVAQARALNAAVTLPESDAAAVEFILGIIGADTSVLAWDFAHIPLPGLADALSARDITIADPHDGGVRVGITGVDAALAATGSIVVSATPGRPRSVSLLPHTHIAVLREPQILPHLDTWIAQQQADPDAFRATGNHVVITGASRTADIAMELVLGAHGPASLHLLVLPGM